ncbi:MAG TPA: hypothetical protein PK668_20675 [Myxococcota bacterium]|nr:hypothetical protein [Myxococcota bacterium]HRY96246.1 hypothetical protein [Myxococcota bacterium]
MRKLAVVLTFLAALVFGFSALAAAPAYVPVQGYLTDAEGNPVDGEVSLELRLWDAMIGGAQVFTETQSVLVEQGFFTLYLGGTGTPALDLAVFRDQDNLFLGIVVNGGAELQPRLSLGSVPYAGFAQYAGDALTLGGLTVEDFRLGTDEVSWDDLTGVPDTLLDGDADALAGLICSDGQVIKYSSAASAWECAVDSTGAGVTEAEVDAFVANNGYAQESDLAPVAFTGEYADLANVPVDQDTLAGIACGVGQVIKWTGAAWACDDDIDTDTDTTLSEAEVDAFVANNGYALSADLELVAFTGDYNDLLNVPAGLLDGDDDTLAGLTCADGQLPAWDDTNAVWECVDDLDTDTLMTLACLDGQVAKWDDVAGTWACADDIDTVNTGDITGVLTPAGSGLAGGGTTGDLSLSVSGVTSAMILDGAIGGVDIANDTIDSQDILDNSIVLGDVALASFDSRYALAGHDHDASYAALVHNHDATYVNEGQGDSITSAMIAPDTITAADLAADAVGASEIATGAVGTLEIAAGAVGAADINTSEVQRRVSGTCVAGSAVRTVNADGTVVCDTGPNAIGSVFEIVGGTGWGCASALGYTTNFGIATYLYNGAAATFYWYNAMPIPDTYAGRNVVLDTVTVRYLCSAGEYITRTIIGSQLATGSYSYLTFVDTDYSGSGSYVLPVNLAFDGAALLALQVASDDAAGYCMVTWQASYHY